MNPSIGPIRAILLGAAGAFALAALVHAGAIVQGDRDTAAATAESTIAAVLLVGAVVGWLRPAWARPAALVALTFALLGDLVGLTIFLLADPDKVLDIAFHVAMAVLVGYGLVIGARQRHAVSSWP